MSNKTIPYDTVHSHCFQQENSLLHCTQSLSNKTIPYHTVQNHCQCATRPFPTAQYKVTVRVQQEISLLHCTQSPSVSTKRFLATLYTLTVCVQQEILLLHCTNPLSVANKPIPKYNYINREFIERFRRLRALHLKEKHTILKYPYTNRWYINKQTIYTKINKQFHTSHGKTRTHRIARVLLYST